MEIFIINIIKKIKLKIKYYKKNYKLLCDFNIYF